MNAEDFKAKVKARCLEVQEYGYTIKRRGWGGISFVEPNATFVSFHDKRVCPIMACLLNAKSPNVYMATQAAAHYFGVSEEAIRSFINGFDGSIYILDVEFYNAGYELRVELGL